MSCPLFSNTYIKCTDNTYVLNKDVHTKDIIAGYKNKPKKVLEVFEVNISKDRQRHIILDNCIELVCSDNHALICNDEGELFDVFPDDLNKKHQIMTNIGLSNVKHVNMLDDKNVSSRFLDIIVEDSYYYCSSNPDIGMILTYN